MPVHVDICSTSFVCVQSSSSTSEKKKRRRRKSMTNHRVAGIAGVREQPRAQQQYRKSRGYRPARRPAPASAAGSARLILPRRINGVRGDILAVARSLSSRHLFEMPSPISETADIGGIPGNPWPSEGESGTILYVISHRRHNIDDVAGDPSA